ncbi:MFS transporter [Salipaludibacillus sp. LMS25]|jgi:MFS family permease|uniref:MFS transporter n=1 Tax=Salipaludibacillus sp. LMS25 TaxID=2924031 RepID=UPI0020D1DB73|nr:MFS transporter [Salipaludibacillus sp. LMS25]UTR14699.1 MFS transporter [Salipaludibacillus sp. LMS25]
MEKRNLVIMWIANFFVSASATMVLPFLSMYIETFGSYSPTYVQRWSGFIFGITFLVAFLVSPFWGRFGDKFGRKKILLFTGYGIAFSMFLMSFVETVSGLFFLRLFMGIVTGFIPTSMALIAAQTSKENAGKVLGTLQMGTVSGGLFGPLLGGLLADSVGFTYTFLMTGTIISFAATLVLFCVKEVQVNDDQSLGRKRSMKEVLQFIYADKVLIMVMIASLTVQIANFSIQPQLALYVGQLLQAENIAFLAGLTFSVTGLGNLTTTRLWGVQGDRIGHEKILLVCLVFSGIFFLPQALVSSIWQLIGLRFLFGMAIGGIIPCATAYIRQAIPLSMQGEVLGYNQSFRFLGNVLGPVCGGVVAGFAGISSVFYVSSFLFFLAALMLYLILRHARPNRQKKRRLRING